MPTVPDSRQAKVAFFASKVTPWTTNTTAIGLATGDATALGTLVTAAQAAYATQLATHAAAKSATLDYNTAVSALSKKGSELIGKIKVKAQGSATPDTIYSLAQLPPPATPSPVGAPGTPTDLKVTLNPDGSLDLAWKCANPAGAAGTVYNVRRKLAGETAFAVIGAAGLREFTDDTIPAGTPSAIYEIRAIRSTRSGVAAQFVVNFGVAGSGETFATVAPAAHAKLAA